MERLQSRKRILLIEDVLVIRMSVKATLGCDYDVDEALTAQKAKNMIKVNKYDVILADLNVGDLKGADTIRAIHEVANGIPIIVCSGNIDREVAVELINLNITEMLSKPIDKDRLKYTVDRVISQNEIISTGLVWANPEYSTINQNSDTITDRSDRGSILRNTLIKSLQNKGFKL